MKKQPKAVYIIENGGYTELTYEEFRRREQICPLYADKLFLPLYGRLMEVSKEDYMEFYRAKRRQKYLDERSADNGDFSYDMLTTDEFSGEDILIAEQPDVCDTVVESIMTDKLRKAILKLTDEERSLNNGERPKYYVENSHPAIIDSATFGRVQEELARRSGKRKVRQKAKTEQGKYSSKYAMTELLVCGECKTPYRRCTWTAGGKKKIVWRCINRLDYGKKYCHNSPTIEESILQKVVMTAIMETANQNTEVLRTLKLHIGMGLEGEKSNDNSLDLQVRIAEIDAEFRKMIDRVSTETVEAFDEETATRLMNEKSRLQQQLDNIADAEQRRENAKSRLDDIYTILDGIKNHPIEYDDQIVRQLLECIVVDSKEQVTVIFKGGLKSVQPLTE